MKKNCKKYFEDKVEEATQKVEQKEQEMENKRKDKKIRQSKRSYSEYLVFLEKAKLKKCSEKLSKKKKKNLQKISWNLKTMISKFEEAC